MEIGIETIVKGLASSGPWALVAGFLLHTLIKAWTADRAALTGVMTEVRDALRDLQHALDRLAARPYEREGGGR